MVSVTDGYGSAKPQMTSGEAVLSTPEEAQLVRRAEQENFPVAMRLLPARTRRNLLAIYGFARHVDDIGDEAPPGTASCTVLSLLEDVTADLDRVFAGRTPRAPALAPLATVIRECRLPRSPFDALVEANRLDQLQTDYATRGQLLHYCKLSAVPVGELVLAVLGPPVDDRTRAANEDICAALQLLEHWQDVGEDAARGRIYLPGQDRVRHGVQRADLLRASAPGRLRCLLEEETAWAVELLGRGSVLVGCLSGTARLALSGYVAGGAATAVALARSSFDPLGGDVRPRRIDILSAAVRLLLRGGSRRAPGRSAPPFVRRRPAVGHPQPTATRQEPP